MLQQCFILFAYVYMNLDSITCTVFAVNESSVICSMKNWLDTVSLLILVSTCVGAVSFHIHRESLYVCISLNNMD